MIKDLPQGYFDFCRPVDLTSVKANHEPVGVNQTRHAGGGVTTRKQDLEGLKQPANPDVKLVAYDVDEMRVMLYYKTAVVTGRVTTKRMVKGAAVTGQSRFTDVFVWRQGRWQLVAGHSSRIRTP